MQAEYIDREKLYGYAASDWNLIDYRMYQIKDFSSFHLRGPITWDGVSPFAVYIGAAQTYGRFCEHPFSHLIGQKYSVPFINMGRGGAGPALFVNRDILERLNGAMVVIVEVMSGRSVSNSLLHNPYAGGTLSRRDIPDSAVTYAADVWKTVFDDYGPEFVVRLVEETRSIFVAQMKTLLNSISSRKILLWFSKRHPKYDMRPTGIAAIFGDFPQLIDHDIVATIRPLADRWVEVVTSRGCPQPLFNRFTGEAHLQFPGTSYPYANTYYPSPEMHEDAAAALGPVVDELMKA